MAYHQFHPPVQIEPHVTLLEQNTRAARAAIWTHVKQNLMEWPDDNHQRVVDLTAIGIQAFEDMLNMSEMQIETQLVTGTPATLWPLHERNKMKIVISLFNDYSRTMNGTVDMRTVTHEDLCEYRVSG